jgi:hypothetical protein
MPALLDANDTFSSEVQIASMLIFSVVGNVSYENEVCSCDIVFLLCFVKRSHMFQRKSKRLFL